jgi:hypothetical protein
MATCSGSLSFFLPKPYMLGIEGTLGTQLLDVGWAASGRVAGLLRKAAYACRAIKHIRFLLNAVPAKIVKVRLQTNCMYRLPESYPWLDLPDPSKTQSTVVTVLDIYTAFRQSE